LPVDLDDIDVAILKSLMEDDQKSFRAISREIKVSTPLQSKADINVL
jgi:DNA-binding Lrp family transcriptional regulator